MKNGGLALMPGRRTEVSIRETVATIWVGVKIDSLGSLPEEIRSLLPKGLSGFDREGRFFQIILSNQGTVGFGVVVAMQAMDAAPQEISDLLTSSINDTLIVSKHAFSEWGIKTPPGIYLGGYTL